MVGEQIRAARKAARKTQEQLASELGVRMMTVSRWERDRHSPSLEDLHRIAAALNVEVADLVGNGQTA